MPRVPRSLFLLVLSALILAACGGDADPEAGPTSPAPAAAEFPVTITDDEGVEVTIEAEPQRIVTFAPSQTEVVFALGLGDRVVGVSGAFDDFPPEATEIEGVGGAGEFGVDPNVERVVELEPDLMLTAFFGGEWKDQLRDAGIPVVTTIAESFDDALADIETVGTLTGATDEAAAVVAEMRTEREAVEAEAAGGERVSCFYEVGFEGGFFTVGPGAIEYELLEIAGCDPVTSDAGEPYPQWSVEQLVADDPEVYVLSGETGGTPEEVAQREGFGKLSAVRNDKVVAVNPDLVSRPGPRLADGLREMFEALHAA